MGLVGRDRSDQRGVRLESPLIWGYPSFLGRRVATHSGMARGRSVGTVPGGFRSPGGRIWGFPVRRGFPVRKVLPARKILLARKIVPARKILPARLRTGRGDNSFGGGLIFK